MQAKAYTLSGHQLDRLKQSLTHWFNQRGSIILGAQLGQMVMAAIRPDPLGTSLRTFVESELQGLIAIAAEATTGDVRYEILGHMLAPSIGTPALAKNLSDTASADLWRQFANPRLTSKIAADPSGLILSAGPDDQLAPGFVTLQRMTSEDYFSLATQFAAAWEDAVERERMQISLQQPPADFYNGWIASLRASRKGDPSALKSWEVTRAEAVARRLYERLREAGVDEARASEIVASARPNVNARVVRPAATSAGQAPVARSATSGARATVREISAGPDADSAALLRQLLHLAIDRMAMCDLQEIRVPAGVLLEVGRQLRA